MYRVKFSNLLQYTVSPWQSMRPRPKTEREELGVHQPSTTVVVHLAAAREPDAVTSRNDEPTLAVPIHSALPQPQPSRLPSVTVLSPRGQSGNLVPRPSPPQVSPSRHPSIFFRLRLVSSPLFPNFSRRRSVPNIAPRSPTSPTGSPLPPRRRAEETPQGRDRTPLSPVSMPCPALPRFASMDCSSSCSALPFFVSSPRGHRVNPGNSVPERACPPCSPAANLLCSVQVRVPICGSIALHFPPSRVQPRRLSPLGSPCLKQSNRDPAFHDDPPPGAWCLHILSQFSTNCVTSCDARGVLVRSRFAASLCSRIRIF